MANTHTFQVGDRIRWIDVSGVEPHHLRLGQCFTFVGTDDYDYIQLSEIAGTWAPERFEPAPWPNEQELREVVTTFASCHVDWLDSWQGISLSVTQLLKAAAAMKEQDAPKPTAKDLLRLRVSEGRTPLVKAILDHITEAQAQDVLDELNAQ